LLLGALVACSIAQLVRDRALFLMLWMFVPVLPMAALALGLDGVRRGRALRVRWLLSAAAIGAALLDVSTEWQPALAPEGRADQPRLRLVQWNTLWGGTQPEQLAALLDGVDAMRPDLAFLSEAPRRARLQRALQARHPQWSLATFGSRQSDGYWYNLAVLGRHPVRLAADFRLETGHAALFDVTLPSRTLHVLMVDLQSSPVLPRSPSIRQVAKLVEARAHTREPVDLVLGDFNTPGRFLGFDALAAAGGGYRRAAQWSGQWRGTWPSFLLLPPFDIDHVWVSKRLSVVSAELFSHPETDHRGQRVDLRL
jgi:endonuclease/exonuclease/phosphatase (EEP) superfamily protein YafD